MAALSFNPRHVAGAIPALVLADAHASRSHKSVKLVHLPKHTAGLTWSRVLKTKLKMYHPTYSGNYQLTFRALELSWGMLLLAYFATAFTIAVVMAALFWVGDCSVDFTFAQVFRPAALVVMH